MVDEYFLTINVHVDLLNIILMDAWGSGGFIGNGDKVRVVNTR